MLRVQSTSTTGMGPPQVESSADNVPTHMSITDDGQDQQSNSIKTSTMIDHTIPKVDPEKET